VLAAENARGLLREVARGEGLLRLGAAHAPARAVRGGLEALRRALAAHDVGPGAHAARDDAELALARAYRALARHPHILPIVVLALHVIVMAIDDLARHL